MKNRIFNRLSVWIIILTSIALQSCVSSKWTVPQELVGQWNSEKGKITVRTEPSTMKFEFTPDSATISLKINDDKTVSGFIGLSEFKNGSIRKNAGNPDITGIAYIVECGTVGKIFASDPLENKEIEIWIKPVKENFSAEIRNKKFPMGELKFVKAKN